MQHTFYNLTSLILLDEEMLPESPTLDSPVQVAWSPTAYNGGANQEIVINELWGGILFPKYLFHERPQHCGKTSFTMLGCPNYFPRSRKGLCFPCQSKWVYFINKIVFKWHISSEIIKSRYFYHISLSR